MEATIPTGNEPTGSYRQSNSDQHLDGPPLGEKQRPSRLSLARKQARRLLETAADELVRSAVNASMGGLFTVLAYWVTHR
ncbi:hypothetical protein ACWCPK_38230 [Streptomyces sp. NPDC001953]